jgi:hypothetical protein
MSNLQNRVELVVEAEASQANNVLADLSKNVKKTGDESWKNYAKSQERWLKVAEDGLRRYGGIGTGIILNYISAKDPRGDGVHTHTITELAVSSSNTQNYLTAYDGTNNMYGRELINNVSIYDPDYYIDNYYIDSYAWFASGINSGNGLRQVISLENVGDDNIYPSGSIQQIIYFPTGDNEAGVHRYIYPFPNYFTKYPGSFYKKNPLQTNLIRYLRSAQFRNHVRHVTTYHGISYMVTGSISGYSGDGSGIYVECVESGSNDDNDGKIFQTVTSIGGQFSGSVYDDTKQYYVVARQSEILTGRSDDATGSVIV